MTGERRRRVAGGSATEYRHDHFGTLLEVVLPDDRRIEYVLDAQGRRLARRVHGQTIRGFLYLGPLSPAAELDAAGNVVSRFVYGSRPNVPDYMVRGSETYQLLTDHLGSVRLVVNVTTGQIVQRLDYDAFGQVTRNTNPDFQPFGFAGGLYDSETQLVRFGARDYDPETGRWLTKDPSRFDGGANLYTYAFNDPLSFVDASGEVPIWVGIVVAGGVVGAIAGAVDGISDYRRGCADWMDVLAAIGSGGAAGLVGSAFGLLASHAGLPMVAAGAVGGLFGYGVKAGLDGEPLGLGDAIFAGAAGAVSGGIAAKAVPINSGWFKPNLRTPRTSWKDFGPHGQTQVRQEAVDGLVEESLGQGYESFKQKKCGCN